ncbi:E3 ubiquitin-protein ligase rnf8-B isoform X1 [Drosophila mauritiana]|uniref:E3 ubiquitin-protein ligase rnf8-B isoform X1 n=2 Tax=Drosophila mauritiana TaxID=7226 RepID=A0A6P8JZI1_DROMA|nr:E3 ubiquitin-protein ligase rnf8-B isoform X1 [Drosophila mauritiana]
MSTNKAETRSLMKMLKKDVIEQLLAERKSSEQKDKQLATLHITIQEKDKMREEEVKLYYQMEEEIADQKLLQEQLLFESKEEINRQLKNIAIENSCCICLDPWEAKDHHRLVSLNCGHLFGEMCIRTHLKHANMCPICRKKAIERDVRHVLLNTS